MNIIINVLAINRSIIHNLPIQNKTVKCKRNHNTIIFPFRHPFKFYKNHHIFFNLNNYVWFKMLQKLKMNRLICFPFIFLRFSMGFWRNFKFYESERITQSASAKRGKMLFFSKKLFKFVRN